MDNILYLNTKKGKLTEELEKLTKDNQNKIEQLRELEGKK